MPSQDVETERVTVSTYVPELQKQQWDEHADRLGMNQSEFVRTMVQTGRRLYNDTESPVKDRAHSGADSESRNDSLAEEVLDVLSSNTYASWDEILGELTGDMEERIEGALDELQREDRIRYSGKNDGYSLVE